jgi:hypothetical protein
MRNKQNVVTVVVVVVFQSTVVEVTLPVGDRILPLVGRLKP